MECGLFGAKLSYGLMLTYNQLEIKEQIPVKLESNTIISNSWGGFENAICKKAAIIVLVAMC